MSYSFKEDVIARLPAGHELLRMFSINDNQTTIETIKNGIKRSFIMDKVDISPYFMKLPTITFSEVGTLNDLYKVLSDMYGLGLAETVDYFNAVEITPTTTPQYYSLPISSNSCGFKGEMRCLVVSCPFSGMNGSVQRDLTHVDVSDVVRKLRVRNHLTGHLFTSVKPPFINTRLSNEFIANIVTLLDEEDNVKNTLTTDLTKAKIVDIFNDGISDIILVLSNGELFHIRFQTKFTNLTLFNNRGNDSKTDDSEELPVGNGNSSAENPVSGEGDINTGEQSELPYSNTEGDITPDNDMEIDIG